MRPVGLLTNCIIYYNTRILSSLLDYYEKTGNGQGASLLNQVSPIAWQHLNFYGRYEFNKGPEVITMEALIAELARVQTSPEPSLIG
ncbi:MAG: hypothetical protein ETSY1_09215 [Candidatus Entotheonella factor]|uniref:Tn3 transposase DDE domain-containing protein n=1 Tax=Entotheonella factor TaxID=1429438 RepID=W4LU87_ENTF1|nr:MAG: hypothetical protein ETSY1_09215 [Candidatus Entotheonella factor]